MERGANLRAVFNRKFTVESGEAFIHQERDCVVIPRFTATDAEGKTRKILKEGDTVTVTAGATVRIMDRVGFVRLHPDLGGGLMMISPHDQSTTLTCEITPKKRVDLSKLDYFAEIYIGG